MALYLVLADTFYMLVICKQISYMFSSFCTSVSCNSIPHSGCSALHGMNKSTLSQIPFHVVPYKTNIEKDIVTDKQRSKVKIADECFVLIIN